MAFSAKDGYKFAISAQNNTGKAFSAIHSDLRKVDVSVKGLASSARSLSGSALSAVSAFAATGAVALAGIVVSTADAAHEIDNLSRIAATTNEQFQGMAYGARGFGIEQDKLADILKDTNDKIGDFMQTGGGAMADFFENIAPRVGVTAANFKDLSGPDALQLYVSSLEKANLSQQEMTFYMEAIASDSTALLPLLRDNGAAMREQAEEAERLGLVLSSVDIAVLEQTDEQMKKSARAFQGFTNQLAVEFAPIISAVSNEFLNAAKEAGGFGAIATRVFDSVISAAGFAADVIRGLEAVWHGIKLVVINAQDIALGYFELIESGVRQLAQFIPGVEVSTETAIGNIRETVKNVKGDIIRDLSEAVNAPMPSENIKIWAEEVKSQAREVAASVAAAQQGQTTEVVTPEEDPEIIAAKARIDHLKMLKDLQIANDSQREELAHLNRLEMLRVNFEEGEIPTIESYNSIKEQLEQKHQDRLSAIEEKSIKDRETWEQASMANKLKFSVGTFGKMFQAFGKHSKKMFEVGKMAAIAETTINTYQSAVGAYKALAPIPVVGPALGAAAAAAAVGFGLAQVKSIKSQSFQGGGGASISVPSAPSTSRGSVTPISSAPSFQQEERSEPPKKTEIIFYGNDDDLFTGRTIRRFLEAAEEQIEELDVSFG